MSENPKMRQTNYHTIILKKNRRTNYLFESSESYQCFQLFTSFLLVAGCLTVIGQSSGKLNESAFALNFLETGCIGLSESCEKVSTPYCPLT